MRKVMQYVAVALIFALPAMAQGMGKSAKKAGAKSSHQLTGCLSGPNGEGAFVLTNGRYRKGLEVGGNDDLKNHVGHEVKLTGTWSTGAGIGENQPAEKDEAAEKGSKKEKHLKVTDITMVSDKCAAAAKSRKKAANKTPGQ